MGCEIESRHREPGSIRRSPWSIASLRRGNHPMSITRVDEAPSYSQLAGIPPIDLPTNLNAALTAGRRATEIAADVFSLRIGPGKLTPQEYFYYQLWSDQAAGTVKRDFVGKIAQGRMHVSAGTAEWFATSADKILFHSIMAGVGLRTPELIATTQTGRYMSICPTIADPIALAAKLRNASLYPLFAKPVAGKYSLSVLSVDHYDPSTDELVLLGGLRRNVAEIAASLVGGAGHLIQRRLSPSKELSDRFGPRLWSVRVLVLATLGGPIVHRAVAKIATGNNPADNYWRTGNRLGALDLATGRIMRVVRGAGADLTINDPHPDTGQPIVGTVIPGWENLLGLVDTAAKVFAGIRTQSWDIALSDKGPVFLELNFGGDLNLHQLAHGAGVLDAVYRRHLRRCGYKGRL